ncbi:probable sphingolipid transporter spinster homolog 2 [Zingiber officinale]|uniref:probable sphingolipid transporter spinster homolog 2 n=1 Tax=Zingiber officinale TaxID=94328 RepID=UPI001C4BE241|nr:probable sphingolipid transporter spinster homolog 2 [Zingiber officinale]
MAIALPPHPDGDHAPQSDPLPSWFSPRRLLVIFCVINMLNYVDRGAIASNGVNGTQTTCTESGTCTSGTGIQGDFNLNYFEDGVLSSAFMVGLLIASPIFASLAKSHNPFRLIGVGLLVWTIATAGCGCAFDFWSITICRMLVGVGEASFISLAAPFIDDNAPVAQKTAWLALFYMCIPSGIAIGYVYGGLVGSYLHWRVAFWGESVLMLPFAILGFTIKPLQLKGFTPSILKKLEGAGVMIQDEQDAQSETHATHGNLSVKEPQNFSLPAGVGRIASQLSRVWKDMQLLLAERVYVVNVLGYIAYNFVIGAYSYWGPKAGYDIYHMSNADLLFGGITIVCGIFGTLAGGFILDFVDSTISNAFKLLSGATFLGAIFCFSAFCFKSLYGFIAFFSIGEILVFATQAPVNYICLHCVNPSLRPLSMAMSTVSIHIFGDVPSSPLVGVLQDYVNNWRESALILTSILFIASAIWFSGIFIPSVDRFNEDSDQGAQTAQRPLLDANNEASAETA